MYVRVYFLTLSALAVASMSVLGQDYTLLMTVVW